MATYLPAFMTSFRAARAAKTRRTKNKYLRQCVILWWKLTDEQRALVAEVMELINEQPDSGFFIHRYGLFV